MRQTTSLVLSVLAVGLLVGGPAMAGKKSKKSKGGDAPAAALSGWQKLDGWSGACYFPPAYKDTDRMTGSAVREELLKQWRGERDDGMTVSDSVVSDVETVLLGKPDSTKSVAMQNLDQCKKAMASGDFGAWKTWVQSLKSSLTEGDCKWPPLRYQQHDYLDIGQSWQFEGRVCKGDVITIQVSALDYYRLSDDSPYINAAGDPDKRAVGDGYPCTLEDCFEGTVIYRFTGDEDGTITVGAVGTSLEFTAPQHGILHLRVNEKEDSFFDNKWRKKGSLIDHAAVSYLGRD